MLTTPVACEQCHTLYPVPATVDYFGLFQLPRGYDIDPAELEDRFLSLSRNVHPDFFNTQPQQVQHLAVRLSAQVNGAYRVLRSPVLRAEYLLELTGGPSAAQDKGVPDGFLGEIMLLREEIEEALAGGDRAAREAHRRTVDERRSRALAEIAALARKLPEAKDAERLKLRQLLNTMKYFDNILNLL